MIVPLVADPEVFRKNARRSLVRARVVKMLARSPLQGFQLCKDTLAVTGAHAIMDDVIQRIYETRLVVGRSGEVHRLHSEIDHEEGTLDFRRYGSKNGRPEENIRG